MNLKKYIIPEARINSFVRHTVLWDVTIHLSYSFQETFGGLFLVSYVLVFDGEIPAGLKEEKLKEYYSRYEKQIPNE